MKIKTIVIAAGGLLLLAAGSLYATGMVDLYRLSQEVDAISREETRTGGAWPRATDACAGCHGQGGNARSQIYPRLAGQPQAYLEQQLRDFASGARNDSIMTPLALSMAEGERSMFAAYFSKLPAAPNATFTADPARVTRGEALAKSGNCASCHGPKLEGKDGYPRLAGQGHDYLREQLSRFQQGQRRDASGVMQAVAASLSPQNIDDLAQYLASR